MQPRCIRSTLANADSRRFLASSATPGTSSALRAVAARWRPGGTAAVGSSRQIRIDDHADRFVPGRDALVTRRRGSFAIVQEVVAALIAHATIDGFIVRIVEDDFFETVIVEIVFWCAATRVFPTRTA